MGKNCYAEIMFTSQAQRDKEPSPTKLQLLPVKNSVKALEKGTHVAERVISTLTLEEPTATFSDKAQETFISLFKSLAQVNNAGIFSP